LWAIVRKLAYMRTLEGDLHGESLAALRAVFVSDTAGDPGMVFISARAGDVLIHEGINPRPHGGHRVHKHDDFSLGRGKANRRIWGDKAKASQ
jgi:hypothetical protein